MLGHVIILNAIINLHADLKVPCGQMTGNKVSTIGGLTPDAVIPYYNML